MNWPYCLAQGRAIREANIIYKVLYNEAQSYSNINTSKLSNASPLPRMHDSGPTGLIIAVQALRRSTAPFNLPIAFCVHKSCRLRLRGFPLIRPLHTPSIYHSPAATRQHQLDRIDHYAWFGRTRAWTAQNPSRQ